MTTMSRIPLLGYAWLAVISGATGLGTAAGCTGAPGESAEQGAQGIRFPICPGIIIQCSPAEHRCIKNECPACCSDGLQAQAVTLATGVNPNYIAVDVANVYWSDDGLNGGSIMGVPIVGGTPFSLASNTGGADGLAILYDSQSPTIPRTNVTPFVENSFAEIVVWGSGTSVMGASALPGTSTSAFGAPFTMASAGCLSIRSVAVDYTNVYASGFPSAQCGGSVMKARIEGGPTVAMFAGNSGMAIAVDYTNVYWVDQHLGVMKMPTAGGPSVTLVPGSNSADYLIDDADPIVGVTATNVYWTDTAGTVMTIPVAGGTAVTLASGQAMPLGLAVDSKNVYWANCGGGTIMKVPLGGGTPTVVASNQTSPVAVAVDGTNVYWTTNGGGQGGDQDSGRVPGSVMKIAK